MSTNSDDELETVPPININEAGVYVVTGRSGSGKTTLMRRLINKKKGTFHSVVLLQPTSKFNSEDWGNIPSIMKFNSNLDNIFKETVDSQENLCQKFDSEGRLNETPSCCIILDDCLGDMKLDDPTGTLAKYSTFARKMNLWIIVLQQGAKIVNNKMRGNGYHIVFTAYESLIKEIREQIPIEEQKLFNKCVDAIKTRYTFFFFNPHSKKPLTIGRLSN